MKRDLLILLVMIVVALLLTTISFEIIQEQLAPALYNFWIEVKFLIRIIWLSQDQYFVWGLFIFLSFLVFFRTIFELITPKFKPEQEIQEAYGPIRKWSRRLNLMEEGVYHRWQFSQYINEITAKIISYRTGKDEQEVIKEIKAGLIDLPSEFLDYLQAAYQSDIRKYFSTYRDKEDWNPVRYLDSNQLIVYIEELLEETGGRS